MVHDTSCATGVIVKAKSHLFCPLGCSKNNVNIICQLSSNDDLTSLLRSAKPQATLGQAYLSHHVKSTSSEEDVHEDISSLARDAEDEDEEEATPSERASSYALFLTLATIILLMMICFVVKAISVKMQGPPPNTSSASTTGEEACEEKKETAVDMEMTEGVGRKLSQIQEEESIRE